MARSTYFCLLLFTIALLSTAGVALAEEQPPTRTGLWLSVGSKRGDTSWAVGIRGPDVSLEMGFVNNSEISESELLDYPVPHNNYTYLGRRRVNGTGGADILKFWDATERISLYGGAGVYITDYREVARSNVSGRLYTQSSDRRFDIAFSGGLIYYATESFFFGMGCHNIRGLSGIVGVTF